MSKNYESFTLVWCERDIEVSYQSNWLNSDTWHLELRCKDRLPVTATGYRSHFVAKDAFSGEEDIRSYVLDWLETAGRDPAWEQYLQESRQLNLF